MSLPVWSAKIAVNIWRCMCYTGCTPWFSTVFFSIVKNGCNEMSFLWKFSVCLIDSSRSMVAYINDNPELVTREDGTVYYATVYNMRHSISLSGSQKTP